MKLKHDLIGKMANMTTTEKDLYLYLCRRQEADGRVRGVYHKDVAAECGMSSASFYNAKNGLAEKGAIRLEYKEKECDMIVIGNDFSDGRYTNYINLNRSVFHRKAFRKLNGRETYFVLEMLKNSQRSESGGCCKLAVGTLYSKYSQILKVKFRTIRHYLHILKLFFSVGIVKGNYYIEYRRGVFDPKPENRKAELNWSIEQMLRSVFRRYKTEQRQEDTRDLISLFKQFKKISEDNGLSGSAYNSLFVWAVEEAVKVKTEKLSLAYVNKLICDAIYA